LKILESMKPVYHESKTMSSQGYSMRPHRKSIVFEQSFRKPMATARGDMCGRTSIILREVFDNGTIGYGEVASVPGFSQFSIDEGLLESENWIHGHCKDEQEYRILSPALASLASSVWKSAPSAKLQESAQIYCPEQNITGSTMKRKIGILPPEQEIDQVLDWLCRLPLQTKVRLDANEALCPVKLQKWVSAICHAPQVEFIEQPTGEFYDDWLFDFAKHSSVPLALDEGCLRLSRQGKLLTSPWTGFYVIKPSLYSNWAEIEELIKRSPDRVVISTCFESPFGYEALIRLASRAKTVPGLDRSCYQGNLFEFTSHHLSRLSTPGVPVEELEKLWHQLSVQ
jgi:O-succinylbenzoate synthase